MDVSEIYDKLKYLCVKAFNQEMPTRPMDKMVKIDDENNSIYITQNLADSPLAVGPRFIHRDFKIHPINPLDLESSGIQMYTINDDDLGKRVYEMRLMKVYHVQGRLGIATDTCSPDGKVVERSTYNHVTRASIDRLMSATQSTYQREMFNYFGVDLRSQQAFDLASEGLLRPTDDKTPPIIYSIRCIKYYKPFYTLEIHIINETTSFIKELIHDIGLRLKTNAMCTQIRRIRDGFVDINSSLVYIDLNNNFEKVNSNMKLVNRLANENLRKYEKTIIAGKTKLEELRILNKENKND